MDRALRRAKLRYSAAEVAPLPEHPRSPSSEHYAAARRWIAHAREAVRWESWGSAFDALSRAEQHRAWARRWRSAKKEGAMGRCRACEAPIDADEGLCEACAIEEEAGRAHAAIRAYFAAARQALRLVRVYRGEPGSSGRREREALAEVRRYRDAVRELREGTRGAPNSSRPGIRKVESTPETRGAGDVKRVG